MPIQHLANIISGQSNSLQQQLQANQKLNPVSVITKQLYCRVLFMLTVTKLILLLSNEISEKMDLYLHVV